MLGHRELTVEDYLAMLRRRLWILVIPAVLGPILAYGVSLGLDERYTSQTSILVEQQKVPENYVKAVMTDDLYQRLGTMQEQILSRTRLQPIIERFSLYKDEVNKVPMEDLVAKLRASIKLTQVKSLVQTRTGELPGFYISVTASNAQTAQQICSTITSMFVEENLKAREQRSQGTVQFLQKQLEAAKGKLDEQDAKLAAFKQRYLGQLPGQEQTNLNILMGLNTQLEAVTTALSRVQQDKTYMEAQLGQQTAAWEASQRGMNPETLEQQLAQKQRELASLEARYTSDHPDVRTARGDVEQLKKKIDQARAENKSASNEKKETAGQVEPPQVQQLRLQIHMSEVFIKEKSRDQDRLQQEIKVYQSRVQLSPMIEQQFKEVTRDYEMASANYNDLLGKKTQSEMAMDMEMRQQGEQFKIMDQANLPEKPSFPNRPLFAAGGLAGGLGLGLGIAFLMELRDKAIRNERDIEFYLGVPTLGLVPSIGDEGAGKRKFWKRDRKAA